MSDGHLGDWYGVATNDDERVAALTLNDNALSRETPAGLCGLSNLIGLNLADNALDGETPAELGSLSNLTRLYLYDNALTSCAPSSLEHQLNLINSDLGDLPFW